MLPAALPLAAQTVPDETASESATASKDAELPTMVVTAAGFEQKITDAPASISVVTQEELSQKPYATLLDAVRDLEGVDVGETRDKTGQGTISMRGMGADYTLVLVDGRRQNNHGDIYPNNFAGNQFNHIPPLDAIERIEVMRGPASTLYGADAMGGVINIITKKVTDKWQGSISHSRTIETRDEFGNDITTDFNLMGPLVPGKVGLSLRGSLYNRLASSPTYDSFTDPSGAVRSRSLGFGAGGKTVDNENEAYGMRLSWTPAANQSLWLDVDTSEQQYDNEPRLNDAGEYEYPVGTVDNIDSVWRGTPNDCINSGTCSRADPRVGYSPTQEFTRDSWSLTHEGTWHFGKSFVSLAHVATNNHGRTLPFTVEERQELLEMLNGTGAYAGMSVEDRKALAEETFLPRPKRTLESRQYTVDAKLDIPYRMAGDHMVVVGAQFIRGELEDGVFGMEEGTPGGVQDHNMWSLFAEDTWYVTTPLAVTAGLRHDDHEVFGSHLSPRLYSVYTLNQAWTVKGGVSTGFKTPKTTQLYDGVVGFGGQGTSPMFGNPDLQPETSTSTEVAAYWQHPQGHNFNVTVFHNRFDDKISSQPCGPGTTLSCISTGDYADLGYSTSTRTTNIDEVVIQGAELAGRWQIMDRLALRANYTYTDSEQKSGAQKGLPLNNSARHMANATLDWRAMEKLNLFLTVEARSKRYRGLHQLTNEELYYKDYRVFHLGASYQASKSITFNARINNLLDEDFTTYRTEFNDLNGDGDYLDTVNVPGVGNVAETLYFDDYNNKDKARNLWLSVNARF
ncbi:MAG: TonB-dependent receptor [Ectothiorhodospiraceae bacterium]|jgi:outer membrane receptor for ferrienterochelin and colicins|nr:TonB-dependent receptor [Ectothiorhodospiraceae bacterium]